MHSFTPMEEKYMTKYTVPTQILGILSNEKYISDLIQADRVDLERFMGFYIKCNVVVSEFDTLKIQDTSDFLTYVFSENAIYRTFGTKILENEECKNLLNETMQSWFLNSSSGFNVISQVSICESMIIIPPSRVFNIINDIANDPYTMISLSQEQKIFARAYGGILSTRSISEMHLLDSAVKNSILLSSPARESNTVRDGQKVRKFKVADNSGSIVLTLWGEIGDYVKNGDVLKIDGAEAKLFKNTLTLSVGRYGKLMRIGTAPSIPSLDVNTQI
ncbi:hypothetical protein BB560_002561 [Smittium megazygosporum]|uniref:Single-stranded DNA binding protein Ssb-like OB fold domain-containing protein n=1 Tax=Smittium megazygosporum TaxID=133381 RepID=A0A2T9ZEG9_9FUNG|nr:hypothetical protein BB560_002561 [Smittium megazygosporum]